jgi:hypothetical protein
MFPVATVLTVERSRCDRPKRDEDDTGPAVRGTDRDRRGHHDRPAALTWSSRPASRSRRWPGIWAYMRSGSETGAPRSGAGACAADRRSAVGDVGFARCVWCAQGVIRRQQHPGDLRSAQILPDRAEGGQRWVRPRAGRARGCFGTTRMMRTRGGGRARVDRSDGVVVRGDFGPCS